MDKLKLAHKIADALNAIDSYSDADKWSVQEEDDDLVLVISDDIDAQMDGLFCDIEITDDGVKCFACPDPENESGDYVLIGEFDLSDRNILKKVSNLVGCGFECALESVNNNNIKDSKNEKLVKNNTGNIVSEITNTAKIVNKKLAETMNLNDKDFDVIQARVGLLIEWNQNDYYYVTVEPLNGNIAVCSWEDADLVSQEVLSSQVDALKIVDAINKIVKEDGVLDLEEK
jgi:hypothetical protein